MGLCISSEKDKVLASYDPMTASARIMEDGLEETTFEISRSHAQRVENLYSNIRKIKEKVRRAFH